MNQIDWKRKLSFRKLWAAIADIVTAWPWCSDWMRVSSAPQQALWYR